MAGGIAHDFNNILGAILGYSELLQQKRQNFTSKEIKYIENILSSGKRAKSLVEQILLFSRKAKPKKTMLFLSNIIKEVCQFLKSTLPANISIEQKIENDLPVFADASQIYQVIMNLCVNAKQAMPNGGKLTITVEDVRFPAHLAGATDVEKEGTSFLCLTVEDTGIGMSKEVTQRIFDPFFTTKEETKGSGLGLSVVMGIVESHDGQVTVESEEGKGTRFYTYLPVYNKKSKKESLRIEKQQSLSGGGERILLVDDEIFLVDMISDTLTSAGYQVTAATDSGKALNIFVNSPKEFDLVITDLSMQGADGTELAKEIKSIRPDIPIILATGFSEIITDKNKHEFGISALIMKPYTLNEIGEIIKEVLSSS